MNIGNILSEAVKVLKNYNVKNPYLDSEILLSQTINRNREFIILNSKKDMNNFYKMLSKTGILAAHDIHNREFPGVNKAWNEFKLKKGFQFKEIVHKKYYFDCGMGIAVKKQS